MELIQKFIIGLILFLILAGWNPLPAQNQVWYDYSLTYFKIQTASDGIFRISSEALASTGLSFENLDPRDFRIFHRGKEVAIHVEGEGDGKMDPQDYIDFFGRKNDAELDKLLYKGFDRVPNPYFNTFSDTTAFFLAITPGIKGKRMSVRNVPSGTAPSLSAFETEQLQVFSDQYSLGVSYSLGFRKSGYDLGQGWMGTVISKGVPRDLTFSNLGALLNSGAATLEIGLVGRSENSHSAVISAGPLSSSLRVLTTSTFKSFEYPQLSIPLQMSDFNANGSLVVRVNPQGSESHDQISVAYAKIKFLKPLGQGDFSSKMMIFPDGNQRVVINQTQENYVAYEIQDLFSVQKVQVSKTGNSLAFQAAVTGKSSKIWIQQEKTVAQIQKLIPVRFRNYLAQPADFLLVGHREMEKPSAKYQNPLKSYAAHRASSVGGGFDTLTIRMEEIYDQYAFGERSPLALYEFLKAYWPVHKPTHLLLAARSLAIFSQAKLGNINVYYRNAPQAFGFQDLVPVGGFPYSDNVFVIGLNPEKPLVPAMAVGRIPAKTSQQLSDYLEKAIEKDQLGVSEPWQKELIHLSGGLSEVELERYFNFLNGFKLLAEGQFLGGNVTTYRKRSNSVVEAIDISGDLNEGKSMLTFFGHGSPTVIDIEVGFASDPTLGYANRGKYPVMLFNGCDYGSAFGTTYTQGEDWVITPQKGASAILANTSIGVDVILRRYSEAFYRYAFSDSTTIYKTIGEIKRKSEEFFVDAYGLAPLNYSHMEQMVMLGDPAARIFPSNKPDYSLNSEEIKLEGFDGSSISALSDSLKLTFVLRNIGITGMDSINYKVERKLPNGNLITFDPIKIPSVSRLDTLFFSIPNTAVDAAGENVFTLSVNPDRSVSEITFANNTVAYTAFIPLSGTMNLYPIDFGIVKEEEINLITQIPGKISESRTILIQLDTTINFNSGFRKEIRVTSDGIAAWPVSLLRGNDSITYFWRTRYQEPLPGETGSWTNSSFSFIPNGTYGWAQRVESQLQQNRMNNLFLDKNWEYLKQKVGIEVFTIGTGVDSLTYRNTQFYYNKVPQIIDNVNNANSRLCPNGSLGLVAIDQKTLLPYLAVPIQGFDILDSRSCGRVPQMIQSIQNAWITSPGNTILQDYVKGVKEGDYVVIFTVGNVTFDAWPDRAYQSLRELGANEATLRALQSGDPYILYGRKGSLPGEAIEIVGNPNFQVPSKQQTLSFRTDLDGYFPSGIILTPKIGPASLWERFFRKVNDKTWINEEEYTQFDVIGVDGEGQEQILATNKTENQLDLSFINPEKYPFLRLKYSMNDPNSTAPAQLEHWQVNFKGVPEGVLTQKKPVGRIRLKEGQTSKLGFAYKNASIYDFTDSVRVEFKLTNLSMRKVENFTQKIPAVKAGDELEFFMDFNSAGKSGENTLEVFANPGILQEQTYNNNLIDLGVVFDVERDNSTSLLDVNFDGIYILDGDLVSPNVMVTAELINDRTFLYKKDTLGMELFIKKNCDSCQFKKINFSNPNLSWNPASEETNFRVSFAPGPLEDGVYTLRITNESFQHPYEISFEVVNESQITNFYPYPNPFSSSVKFVFTVTGSEVPDEVKIQIMTVSGRVVREILQSELGVIRIGNNITEYAWDGRDEYGDQLANGVYIYRVLVKKNGQFMEHRATAGDKAFSKGYGKMYLLR